MATGQARPNRFRQLGWLVIAKPLKLNDLRRGVSGA
jgi:hypothetical protein